MIMSTPELKNQDHLEKVKSWYSGVSNEDYILLLSSGESQSIFLVEHIEDGEMDLARVFSFGDRVEISIDYKSTMGIESVRQLILNFQRVNQ